MKKNVEKSETLNAVLIAELVKLSTENQFVLMTADGNVQPIVAGIEGKVVETKSLLLRELFGSDVVSEDSLELIKALYNVFFPAQEKIKSEKSEEDRKKASEASKRSREKKKLAALAAAQGTTEETEEHTATVDSASIEQE